MAENNLTDAGTGAAADAVRDNLNISVESQDATPVVVAKDEPAEATQADPPAAEEPKDSQADAGQKRVQTMPEWAQKRFDQLAFEKREAERRAKKLEEDLAAARAGKPNAADTAAAQAAGPDPNAANGGYGSKAEFDAAVAAEAERREAAQREQAAQETFNMACNTAYAAGTQAYPDFEAAVDNLRQAGAMQRDLLDMVLETENPSKILYELGSDPARAQQIAGMTPAKRAMELAKMATAAPPPKTPAPITKAPPPLNPVDGTARVSADLRDEDDDAAWFAKRNAQVAARQGR